MRELSQRAPTISSERETRSSSESFARVVACADESNAMAVMRRKRSFTTGMAVLVWRIFADDGGVVLLWQLRA